MSVPSGRAGIVAAAVLVLVLGIAGFAVLGGDEGGGDGKQGGSTPPNTEPTVPEPGGGALFGVHTEEDDDSAKAEIAAVQKLETHLGRTLDIEHSFYPWDKEFPTELERWDIEGGRIPMISWNGRGVYTDEIAAGSHDPLIQDRALKIKDLKGQVMIRWFWEMDGNNKAEWAKSPEDYQAAWRHIVDVFRNEGVENVDWVWCPNASAFRDGQAQAFYPGDDYVDWICADGYNWAPGREGDEWRAFRDIFDGFYAWAAQKNKPIMVGEYGVQERGAGEKAAWVADATKSLKTDFPLIRAVVYFSANKDYDWRMNTSPESYAAFKVMANDPWLSVGREQVLKP